jgi:hypothetical protein
MLEVSWNFFHTWAWLCHMPHFFVGHFPYCGHFPPLVLVWYMIDMLPWFFTLSPFCFCTSWPPSPSPLLPHYFVSCLWSSCSCSFPPSPLATQQPQYSIFLYSCPFYCSSAHIVIVHICPLPHANLFSTCYLMVLMVEVSLLLPTIISQLFSMAM